jgi:4-amino-4-deoxy-L-arabinose transferase-like glycosyltransferase
MLSTIFLVLGCVIFVLLGCIHWISVLYTNKFEPEDNAILDLMKNNNSRITNQTSIWNGLTGFHISHSLGLIIFGILSITLAIDNPDYLFSSNILKGYLLVLPAIYIVLAQKYWFSLPRNGFIIGFVLIILSVALS